MERRGYKLGMFLHLIKTHRAAFYISSVNYIFDLFYWRGPELIFQIAHSVFIKTSCFNVFFHTTFELSGFFRTDSENKH